ncbi:MAG: ComF family protein [bacterium]|nr:ComF family protein [bacterium]
MVLALPQVAEHATNYINMFLDPVINFVFPANCEICGSDLTSIKEKYVCFKCLSKIRLLFPPFCHRCGKGISSSFKWVERPLCKECLKTKRYFCEARAVSRYEGIIKECIHLIKYKKRIALYKPLMHLLIDCIIKNWQVEDFDFIIPVPLHKSRLRKRTFNQAELFSSSIGKYFGIPVSDSLKRYKDTPSQVNLSEKERVQNVKDAFLIRKKDHLFKDKVIMLIDDVYTTGATVNECSKVLMEAGAKKVYVLTLAHG